MGIVLQAQRRAIESLCEGAEYPPAGIEKASLFLDNKQEIFIIGVSAGFGTCSDIHNMDVLVTALASPKNKLQIPHGSSIASCKYVILFRNPTKQEVEEAEEYLCATSLMVVELLKPIVWTKRKIIFQCTGRVECYANFV